VARFTFWVDETAAVPYTVSPPYEAVITWGPAVLNTALRVPVPFVRVTVPSEVAPSSILTLPVGVGPPPETVTVNVIGWPTVLGLGDPKRLMTGIGEIMVVVASGAAGVASVFPALSWAVL